jgi:NADH dehydrogenase
VKWVEDGVAIRTHVAAQLERATLAEGDERRALLTFVIVGGGATGVEMAGAIAELARRALASDFRSIDPRSARVVLVEAGQRLLPAFDSSLSEAARLSLEKLGVEVRLGVAVTNVDASGVTLGGVDRIAARTVMWAAGVMASSAGQWLRADTDRAGRVKVNADLTLHGHPEIFVIGDTALAQDSDGKPLPGVAPVAKQQGYYVGRLLKARSAGKSLPPFRYRDYGSLATIGRKSAVVEMAGFKFTGFIAWLLWSIAHIYFLIGFRNRAVVAMNWIWSYLTFQRGTRLITGITGARMEGMARPQETVKPPMRGAA